ncbi:hypothetical protein GWG54_06670 [Natronococcus sp. JC468]|uniref:hypothetical protein n=1 Tax=Natronococcus sp. JC468 TaxID=1961921 RepID=UPI001439ACDF|nr:hypothetical protein [Natronococcus sp. JC468]NKE35502.1 hypothetical protein [Natronococcus sp. JC468]
MTADPADGRAVRRRSSDDSRPNASDAERFSRGRGDARGFDGRVPTPSVGFAALGALAFVAGLALPDGRAVLFALAGIGGFAAVLAFELEPERAIEARDATRVYETSARNLARLAETIGATGDRRYAPVAGGGPGGVRLVVPLAADRPRSADAVGDGGEAEAETLSLEPIGAPFVAELERSLEDGLTGDPERLAEQLTDALAARFEIVDRADPSVSAEDGRLDVAVSAGVFGPVDRFDHPVASILGVGLAVGLERPVDAIVLAERTGERRVTCRWEPDGTSHDDADAGDVDG